MPSKPEHVARVKVERRGPAKRGTRTLGQAGAGYLVAELFDTVIELDEPQLALLALVLTALFSWVQTAVEDYLGRGFLRDVPDVETDLPDERGATDVLTVAILVVLVIVVLAAVGAFR